MVAFARSLARDLRSAREKGEEKKVYAVLFEAMGFSGGVNWRDTDAAHAAFDRTKQQVKPGEFSVRDLFEHTVTLEDGTPIGRELIESFSQRKHGRNEDLLEAGPIDTSMFSQITGQIFFASTLEAFMQPDFIGGQLFTTVPTDLQEEEKIPGISLPGDMAEAVGENQPYPEVGLSQEWIMTPEKVKRGFMLSFSKESIRGDRTGLLLDRGNTGSLMMGINKEKRQLDVALGVSTLYRRNGGAAQATYGNTHTQGTFDNLSGDALADWTDIEAAMLLFDAITDPNTGEPIVLTQRQVIVPTALLATARRILNATEIREVTNTNTTTIAPNPLAGTGFTILSNPYVKSRSGSATAWWLGDFQRGFKYRENWPFTQEEEREGGPRAFSHDTVLRFKFSEKGVATVEEPRYAVQGNA